MTHIGLIAQSTGTATFDEWTKLGLTAPKSRVLRVKRVQYDTPQRPMALEEVVLPLDRFPGLTADASEITEIAQRYGLSLGRASEHVSIVPATKDVAAHLGVTAGENVMKLDRIVETADGKPIEWRVTFRKI